MQKHKFLIVVCLGLLCTGIAFEGGLGLGFFADDFFMGRAFHERARLDPSLAALWQDSLTHRWTEEFHVFRPFTIFSLGLDWRTHGADPTRHRWTNLLLAVLFAFAVAGFGAALARRLPSAIAPGEADPNSAPLPTSPGEKRTRFALLFFLALNWPTATEAVGWLVAREDLLCGLFAALGSLLLARFRRLPWLLPLPLAAALCSKETAVTLPFLWMALDLCLLSGGWKERLKRTLLRALPCLLVLAAYFALRAHLFGAVTGNYAGRSFESRLADQEIVSRIGIGLWDSAMRLLSPLNQTALAQRVGQNAAPILVYSLMSGAGLLFAIGVFGRGLAGLRLIPLTLAFLLLPLPLLLAVVGGVTPEMDKSRFLVIPSIGLFAGFAAALSNPRPLVKSLSFALALALLLGGALGYRSNWTSHQEATARVASLLKDLHEAEPLERPIWLFGAQDPLGQPTLHPALMGHEGCHMLSNGIYSAMAPPFYERNRALVLLPLDPSPAFLPAPAERPVLLRLVDDPDLGLHARPATVIGSGLPTTSLLDPTPPEGSTLSRAEAPSFSFGIREEERHGATRWRLKFWAFGEEQAIATGAIPEGTDSARIRVSGPSLEVHRKEGPTGFGLSAELMPLVQGSAAIYWVELLRGSEIVAASDWIPLALAPLAPGP